MQKGLCFLLFLYQKEYQNYLSKVSCCKNIILCNFIAKSKLKLCWTMLLLYIIKCRLFTRKWHKMEQSLMWQNGIWWVEYNSSMWNIAYCSCRAMIGHVLIRFWTLFSWYMFGMCILSKGAEKTPFNFKKWCKKLNGNLSYHKKSWPFNEDLAKATNHWPYQMSPKYLINVILSAQPPNSMTLDIRYQNVVIWLV